MLAFFEFLPILLIITLASIVLTYAYFNTRRYALRRVSYKRYFTQHGVFEGDSAEFIEVITNNSFIPLFWVDVEQFLPSELALEGFPRKKRPMQRFISRFNLAPFVSIKRTVKVECLKRGDYKLDSVTVKFFLNNIFIESKARLYVYPRALSQNENNPLNSDAQSLYLSDRKLIQDPFSLSGIREYTRGDPFRSINFKATAKTRTLMVNTREFLSVRNFMLYMDFHVKTGDALPPKYGALLEQALSWAAGLLQKAIESNCAAGFAANCRLTTGERFVSYPMGMGGSHYTEILTEMAKVRMNAGNSLLSVISRDINRLRNAEVYIYTFNPRQDFGGYVEVLRQMGNSVSVVEIC
jgi:uncharacterized protein (DUF58 family)